MNGYRSGLEGNVALQLQKAGVLVRYEDKAAIIHYTKPESAHRYTPDFVLPSGIVIETKGRFLADDRKKHLLIKQQHPSTDVRFVFTRSATRISKTSKTTYAAWCQKNGFQFADKLIPEGWLKEHKK